jgi:hypothetical protein
MTNFDVKHESALLRVQTEQIRKRGYRKSRLDAHKGELLLLHREGIKPAELQRWLRAKRIKVELSTVTRWLARNG